ncbi:MAG: RNA polymerase sigma factor [Acidimicrobiales bacterium]
MTEASALERDVTAPFPIVPCVAEPSVRERMSFEELYTSSYQSLVRLAFVLTGSSELSEDLVQDCFVRLHPHYDRLESPDRYAKQAVVNACRSHFRKVGRERDRRPLLYVVDGEAGGDCSSPRPDELHDVLLTLPYRQRAAVVLRYYADLSEIEIAEALGCRPGTVGSLIHRGLERMRGAIER